jgi:hypothetical protein
MKLTFRQSGGFAGLSLGCEIDDATLPRAEAARLRRLVQQCRLEDVAAPAGARDVTTYEITIETPGGVRRATFHDLAVPERAQPLLDFLQRRAAPRPLP